MKRDAVFGPVVAFGLGGVLTEALGDVALGVAPLDDREAAELPGLHQGQAAARLVPRLSGGRPGRAGEGHPGHRPDGARPSRDRRDRRQPALVQGDRPVAADALIILSDEAGRGAPERSTFKPNLKALLAPAVHGGGRRFRRHHQVGRFGPPDHHRRRLHRHHLPGEPQGRRVLRPARPTRASRICPRRPTWPCWPSAAIRSLPCSSSAARKGIKAAIAIAAGFSETGEVGRRGRAGDRPHRHRRRRHSHGPQLHGHDLQRGEPARGRLRDAPPAQGHA